MRLGAGKPVLSAPPVLSSPPLTYLPPSPIGYICQLNLGLKRTPNVANP